jgi:hypothetical protein
MDRLSSAAGFSSHRVKTWFGVKSDYTGLKRIRSNPLELIGIPLGDDVPLCSPALRAGGSVAAAMIMHIAGRIIYNHTEVAV